MDQAFKLRTILFFVLMIPAVFVLAEGTKITPPQNKFPLSHDVEIGKEAAGQVRQELPLLPENGDIDTYVKRVGQGLVVAIPSDYSHPEFHYEFRVVNVSDINAFALPGGPMFVNRGMIESAHNEGEMAGVMAHEISHVALRHGTAQETKAQKPGIQLGAIGATIAGALGGNIGKIAGQVGSAGLGLVMNKFSREDETQADVLGAQIMAKAGYNPQDLANMFKTIEKEAGSGGPQWMSDHPNPGNRYDRISQEAKLVTIASGVRSNQAAEFSQAQTTLKAMPKAKTTSEIEAAKNTNNSSANTGNAPISANVERPAGQFVDFEQKGLFGLSVPANWKQLRDNSSVTFAPTGAYGAQQGRSVVTHGAIVGVAAAQSNDLTSASDRFVEGVLQGNSYLSGRSPYTRVRLGNWTGLQRRLTGLSPVTRRQEIVDVSTALIGNGQLLYIAQIVPSDEQDVYRNAFLQMLNSVHAVK